MKYDYINYYFLSSILFIKKKGYFNYKKICHGNLKLFILIIFMNNINNNVYFKNIFKLVHIYEFPQILGFF